VNDAADNGRSQCRTSNQDRHSGDRHANGDCAEKQKPGGVLGLAGQDQVEKIVGHDGQART
jgi:hypothetical protein